MSETTDPESAQPLSPPTQSYYAQQAQKSQQFAEIAAAIETDLRTNPRYDAFFAPYHPQVREQFTRDYVNQKMLWLRFGDFYERHLTGQLTQFEQEAYTRLWDIQQKKLFDLQCRWRAEEVQLPGVQLSCDFLDLSTRIENCPLISPITDDELALYMRFVEQADYVDDLQDRYGSRFGWQDYDDVKAAYVDEEEQHSWLFEEVPTWYFFHNQHTGNDQLLHLPNLRGQKEERYLDAWRADNHARMQAQRATAPPPPPADSRPAHLGYEEGQKMRDEFARQFESLHVNRQRTAYQAANPPADYEDEEMERVLDFLNGLDEPVPIEAGPDWRRAVMQAAYDLRKHKLLINLPLVYQAYQQRREWGIAHPPAAEPNDTISDIIRNGILAGRRLLGEPENFDF